MDGMAMPPQHPGMSMGGMNGGMSGGMGDFSPDQHLHAVDTPETYLAAYCTDPQSGPCLNPDGPPRKPQPARPLRSAKAKRPLQGPAVAVQSTQLLASGLPLNGRGNHSINTETSVQRHDTRQDGHPALQKPVRMQLVNGRYVLMPEGGAAPAAAADVKAAPAIAASATTEDLSRSKAGSQPPNRLAKPSGFKFSIKKGKARRETCKTAAADAAGAATLQRQQAGPQAMPQPQQHQHQQRQQHQQHQQYQHQHRATITQEPAVSAPEAAAPADMPMSSQNIAAAREFQNADARPHSALHTRTIIEELDADEPASSAPPPPRQATRAESDSSIQSKAATIAAAGEPSAEHEWRNPAAASRSSGTIVSAPPPAHPGGPGATVKPNADAPASCAAAQGEWSSPAASTSAPSGAAGGASARPRRPGANPPSAAQSPGQGPTPQQQAAKADSSLRPSVADTSSASPKPEQQADREAALEARQDGFSEASRQGAPEIQEGAPPAPQSPAAAARTPRQRRAGRNGPGATPPSAGAPVPCGPQTHGRATSRPAEVPITPREADAQPEVKTPHRAPRESQEAAVVQRPGTPPLPCEKPPPASQGSGAGGGSAAPDPAAPADSGAAAAESQAAESKAAESQAAVDEVLEYRFPELIDVFQHVLAKHNLNHSHGASILNW